MSFGRGEVVTADPHYALSSKSASSLATATELHLANLGATHLSEKFALCSTLEVLWLNGNSLSELRGLECCPTITTLFLHNNLLKTLVGSSLSCFTFLQELTLGGNQLSELQTELKCLSHLRHLKYLDLTGNPLTEEPQYRLLVLKGMPWLEVLDKHRVQDTERAQAKKMKLPRSWLIKPSSDPAGSARDLSSTVGQRISLKGTYRKAGAGGCKPRRSSRRSSFKDEHESSTRDDTKASRLSCSGTDEEIVGKHNLPGDRKREEPLDSSMLDPWEEVTLKTLLRNADADKSGWLSRDEIQKALKLMEAIGRKPVIYDVEKEDEASVLPESVATEPSRRPESVDEEMQQSNLDLIFQRIDSNGDGKISIQEFLSAIVAEPSARLEWAWLTPSEASELSNQLYAEADAMRERIAMVRGGAPADLTQQRQSLVEKVHAAVRLEVLASGKTLERESRRKEAGGLGRRDFFCTLAVPEAAQEGEEGSRGDMGGRELQGRLSSSLKLPLLPGTQIVAL
ncbi:unnamed protein product [Chrysoparadoxa australica]